MTNGNVPPTEEIPEPPRHRIEFHNDAVAGPQIRFVDSRFLDEQSIVDECNVAYRKHLIIKCALCGHVSKEWGISKHVVRESHDYHFQTHHVGRKTVWHPEVIDDYSIRELIQNSRFRVDSEYEAAYRGDIEDEQLEDLVGGQFDEEVNAAVIVHRPPIDPYPNSPEEGESQSIEILSL